MSQDVYKIFSDLELKAVGLDDKTKTMQAGYFTAFRSLGLPIHKEDFQNPYNPLGGNVPQPVADKPPADPKDAPKGGSSAIDPNASYVNAIGLAQQNFVSTFQLVDDKLRMNSSYEVMPGSSKLSDTWFAIVNGANGIPPTEELNAAMKQAYTDAAAVLQDAQGDPTPHYEAYMTYEEAYRDKVKARNRAYADSFTDPVKANAFPVNGVVYQDDVDEAWNRWTALGHKEEIEKALATLEAQGIDPAILLIGRAKKRYNDSLLEFMGIGELPNLQLSPRSWYDADEDDGWTTYTQTDFESSGQYNASQTAFSAGASVNAGLWSASASFEHKDSQANANFEVKNLKVSFSYAVVDINRTWLDTSLLNLSNWFLMGDYKKGCISDGTTKQEMPATGETSFLPSVMTSLILVKDVTISWDDWKNQWSQHTTENAASASVGVMCFTAKASYSHATQQRQFDCTDDGGGLSIPGIQLIGYVSAVNPMSPQKDSAPYLQPVAHAQQ